MRLDARYGNLSPRTSRIRKRPPRAIARRARAHGCASASAPRQRAKVGRPLPPRIPIRPPAVAATDGGRRAPGALTAGAGCASALCRQNRLATRKYRPAHLRRGRAGCASTSRRSGARRRSWVTGTKIVRHPPTGLAPIIDASALRTARIAHPRAGGRGDGQRAVGGGSGPRAAKRVIRQPEVSPGAPAPRACRLRVGVPAKWPRADVPG